MSSWPYKPWDIYRERDVWLPLYKILLGPHLDIIVNLESPLLQKKKKLIDIGMGQRTIFGSDLLEKTDKKKGSATSV